VGYWLPVERHRIKIKSLNDRLILDCNSSCVDRQDVQLWRSDEVIDTPPLGYGNSASQPRCALTVQSHQVHLVDMVSLALGRTGQRDSPSAPA